MPESINPESEEIEFALANILRWEDDGGQTILTAKVSN